jgi:hypothetical protein
MRQEAGIFFYVDVCGPMSQESLDKAKYFVFFKDDFSGFRFLYYLCQKSDVLEHFKALYNLVVR